MKNKKNKIYNVFLGWNTMILGFSLSLRKKKYTKHKNYTKLKLTVDWVTD